MVGIDRWGWALVGLLLAGTGVMQMVQVRAIPYSEAHGPAFIIAGVLILASVIWSENKMLAALAGTAGVCAYVLRAVNALLSWLVLGEPDTWQRAILLALVYGTSALVMQLGWWTARWNKHLLG